MQSLVGRQAVFTLGMLGFGCLEAGVAVLAGQRGVEGVVYSVLLCLVPGWLTIYIGELLRFRDLAAYVMLAGTGLRMVFVLVGLIAVTELRRDLGVNEFAVWLIAGYLVALGLETWMVLMPSTPGSTS